MKVGCLECYLKVITPRADFWGVKADAGFWKKLNLKEGDSVDQEECADEASGTKSS